MSALDMHLASDAEKIEAFRNVHDVWGGGLSVEEHVKRRLASVQHNRADWFVGCADGRVAASLGCYPLKFCFRGNVVKGIAIGAVHTHSDFRGRGFAPQLMRFVEEHAAERGAAISMLYSDIACDYYARMGYVECPSRNADVELSGLARNPVSDSTITLRRCQPEEFRAVCRDLYNSTHAQFALSIHRDEQYWEYLHRKGTNDLLHLVEDSQANAVGYLRAAVVDGAFLIRDVALPGWEPQTLRWFFAAVAEEANSARASRLAGWLPTLPEEPGFPSTKPRRMEITMLKALADDVSIDEEILRSADFLHEIDHV